LGSSERAGGSLLEGVDDDHELHEFSPFIREARPGGILPTLYWAGGLGVYRDTAVLRVGNWSLWGAGEGRERDVWVGLSWVCIKY
jgi:hypothetical protein